MLFWIAAFMIAALVVSLIVGRLLGTPSETVPSETHDLRIYRDQLAEVARDRERGVLSPEAAERARLEVSRRILDADRALQARAGTGRAPRALTYGASAAVAAVLVAGSAAVYLWIGAPGYGDVPISRRLAAAEEARADRPDQATAEATRPAPEPSREPDPAYVALVERLRDVVAKNPGDKRGLKLLARHEAALGNFDSAYEAQARLIAAEGEAANAAEYAARATYLIQAAGGYVSPEAETAIARALKRDSANGVARYFAGLLEAQTGRPDRAFRRWRTLLEESAPDAPWVRPIRAQIVQTARRAGIRYQLPDREIAPRPTEEQVATARAMSEGGQAGMIRGMVSGLAERLANEGGSAAEWARLVRAYGVLGEDGKQADALAQAEAALAGDQKALARLRAAAETSAGAAAGGAAAEARRLSHRLAERGGGPDEWARLIALLGETGRTDRARAIWQEAQQTFADAPPALATIRKAAGGAGLLE